MAKKRTTQLLAELKTLASSAADNLYRRIGLAAEVMLDLDWIARTHDGSDLKAHDALQDGYFRDLGGFISLGKLIQMFSKIPVEQWKEVKFDVAAVEIMYNEATSTEPKDGGEKGVRTAWKPLAEERGKQVDRLTEQVKQTGDLATRQTAEIDQLKARICELTRENERLQGRVEELEKMMHRQPVVA